MGLSEYNSTPNLSPGRVTFRGRRHVTRCDGGLTVGNDEVPVHVSFRPRRNLGNGGASGLGGAEQEGQGFSCYVNNFTSYFFLRKNSRERIKD